MTKHAEIKVASGPDRGKIFPLLEETVHIGSSEDNQIVLEDDLIAETHLSITRKNGRYAVYTSYEGAIEIDGNILPSEQWVWLPYTARIQLTNRTVVLFDQPQILPQTQNQPQSHPETKTPVPESARKTASVSDASASRESSPTESQSGNPGASTSQSINSSQNKQTKKNRQKKSAQSVAKFITNREGEALVQLGSDGKLPELDLHERDQPTTKRVKKQSSNPNLLYAILAASFFSSLMLLLVDFSSTGSTSVSIKDARTQIAQYYEKPGEEPKKYQLELRQAELAHAKGDFRKEKRHYRNVLFMLQAQDLPLNGITGKGVTADEELKSLIVSLIGQK